MITVAKPLTFSSDEGRPTNRKGWIRRMAASRHPVSSGRRSLWWLPGSAATLVILLFSIGPLVALLWQAGPLPRALLGDPYLRHVLGFSLWQALLSTLLSLGLAIPVARGPGATPFHRTPPAAPLFGLSLVLPVIIAIFGMVAVHGRQGWLPQLLHGLGMDPGNYLYGLFGILLAHVFFNMPLAARLILQSIEHPRVLWRLASQLGMRSSHIFRLLEWPLIRGILPGLASLIFMLCFTSFTTVLALGGGPKSTTWRWLSTRRCALTSISPPLAGSPWCNCCRPWPAPAATQAADHPGQSPHQPSPLPASRQTPEGQRSGGWLFPDHGLAIFLPPLLAIVVAGSTPVCWRRSAHPGCGRQGSPWA